MAFATSTIALIGLAVAAGGAVMQYTNAQSARRDAERSANEQRKARAEQSASQSLQQAQEQRQQIREERVRRAQIMQASQASGTAGSSTESGALGGMSSQLGSNIGFNRSQVATGQAITGFNQAAADFSSSSQRSSQNASLWGNVGSIGMGMFNQAGGFKTMFSKPAGSSLTLNQLID